MPRQVTYKGVSYTQKENGFFYDENGNRLVIDNCAVQTDGRGRVVYLDSSVHDWVNLETGERVSKEVKNPNKQWADAYWC